MFIPFFRSKQSGIARAVVFIALLNSPQLSAQALTPLTSASDTWPAGNAASRGSFRSVLRPIQDLRLSSRAAGIVERFYVAEGQEVKAGSAIVSLDSDQEVAEIQQAEAICRGAQAEANRADAELKRIELVNSSDEIYSKKQLIDASAQAQLSKSRLEQANAALTLAKVRLANRTVSSPIDGIFLKSSKSIGEAVDRFETIARVVDISSLEMTVYCDSQYLSLFRHGDSAKIRLLKNPENQPIITGKIVHIDPIVDPSSGTFRVKLQLPRTGDASPGISAILLPPALPSTKFSSLGP